MKSSVHKMPDLIIYDNDHEEEKRLLRELDYFRRLAFVSVVLSVMATVCASIVVPMVYARILYAQTMMRNELDFCKLRASNVWNEVTKTKVNLGR